MKLLVIISLYENGTLYVCSVFKKLNDNITYIFTDDSFYGKSNFSFEEKARNYIVGNPNIKFFVGEVKVEKITKAEILKEVIRNYPEILL